MANSLVWALMKTLAWIVELELRVFYVVSLLVHSQWFTASVLRILEKRVYI